MVTATALLKVIFVSSFLSAKNCVDGLKHRCPKAATFDLTGEEPDSTGSVNKSGYVFPRKAMWSEGGKTFGCPCDFKVCVAFCCPPGIKANADGCVKKNLPHDNASKMESETELHLYVDDPCGLSFIDRNLSDKNYVMFPSGSMTFFESVQLYTEGSYCLLVEENTKNALFGFCETGFGRNKTGWFVSCLSISTLFAVATFIAYSVIPKLKNLQGSMFRCYLASYIACVHLAILVLLMRIPAQYAPYLAIPVYGAIYFGFASMTWLNVMSFDIWRKFREFRSVPNVDIKKRQKAKFVWYSIYSWISSLVIVAIIFGSNQLVDEVDLSIVEIAFGFPFVCSGICDVYFFISTALKIRQTKKDTEHMIGGMNKHHQETEQWFTLYMKLFMIMGVPLIFWAIALYWENVMFGYLVLILEALQGISIFITFVWKDDVKRLLRQRFDEIWLRVLVSFHRRYSTPASEN